MTEYGNGWTEEQQALYDECQGLGRDWAIAPETPADQLQQVIDLAEADEDELGQVELAYPPLVDAVAEATGTDVATVTATRADPAFRGFVEGARTAAARDVFGL